LGLDTWKMPDAPLDSLLASYESVTYLPPSVLSAVVTASLDDLVRLSSHDEDDIRQKTIALFPHLVKASSKTSTTTVLLTTLMTR